MHADLLSDLAERIAEAVGIAIESMRQLDDQRWRYVEDGELPEVGDSVLWTKPNGIIREGERFCVSWVDCNDTPYRLSDMRAWRPLPKPAPERKKEDSHA